MTWYDMKSYIYKYTLKLKNDVPKFGNLKFFVYICKNPMLFLVDRVSIERFNLSLSTLH